MTNKEDDGHYHNKGRKEVNELDMGGEIVTYRTSYCTRCGIVTEHKVLKREKKKKGK